MTRPIIWVHGDNLNPYAPTFVKHPNTPALFVFDEQLLAQWQISFKRIVFIYESLLELPVSIRKGNVIEELGAFIQENQADHVVTMNSPSPRFREIVESFDGKLEFTVLNMTPLVDSDEEFDLARFSKFWRKAKLYAMKPS